MNIIFIRVNEEFHVKRVVLNGHEVVRNFRSHTRMQGLCWKLNWKRLPVPGNSGIKFQLLF